MKKAVVRVGIRDGRPHQASSGGFVTTADVAMWQEFGTPNMAARSWLFTPIKEFVKDNKFKFGDESVQEYGDRAKQYVLDYIKSSGNGSWAGAKSSYTKKKSKVKVKAGDAVTMVDSGDFVNDIEAWVEWL